MASLTESRKQLQEDFISLKKMNSELIFDLTEWGEKNKISDRPFMQKLSLWQCIDVLKEVREKALTDENYDGILNCPSMKILEDVGKNVAIQIRHHKEVRDLFNAFTSNN